MVIMCPLFCQAATHWRVRSGQKRGGGVPVAPRAPAFDLCVSEYSGVGANWKGEIGVLWLA